MTRRDYQTSTVEGAEAHAWSNRPDPEPRDEWASPDRLDPPAWVDQVLAANAALIATEAARQRMLRDGEIALFLAREQADRERREREQTSRQWAKARTVERWVAR